MQGLVSLIGFQYRAEKAFFGSVMDQYVRPVGGGRLAVSSASFLFTRWKTKPASSHGGVAMEVVIEGTDARRKRLSDVLCKRHGMRCVDSSFSVLCNVNDTVEDALRMVNANLVHSTDQKIRSLWEKKKISGTSTITANVYYHYAKFTYIDGAHINVVDVVHPKHEVITLHLDTKLWRAKEIMNDKRPSLEKEGRETYNVFGKFTEFIWRTRSGGSCSNFNYPQSRFQITEENRLWLEIRSQ